MVELILKDEVNGGTFRVLMPKKRILGVFIEDDGGVVIVLERREGLFNRRKKVYCASAEGFYELAAKLTN